MTGPTGHQNGVVFTNGALGTPKGMELVGQLGTTLDAAMDFGLSENEIWAAMAEACVRVPHAGPGDEEARDELAGALARRILERERRRAHES